MGQETELLNVSVRKHEVCRISGFQNSYEFCHLLGGLLVRVPGCRQKGPGFDSRRCQIFGVAMGLEQGAINFVSINEELIERKVAAPV
jgi:hypothetical protein